MGRRTDLQDVLEEILGSREVYFQPPETVKMKFPCIVYERLPGRTLHADDAPYAWMRRYQVTVIDLDPDSDIPDRVEKLKTCTMTSQFTADNLNHFVFNLYY